MNFKAAHGKVERKNLFSSDFIKWESKGKNTYSEHYLRFCSHLQEFWYLRISNWVVCSLKNESFTVSLVLVLLISLFSLSLFLKFYIGRAGFLLGGVPGLAGRVTSQVYGHRQTCLQYWWDWLANLRLLLSSASWLWRRGQWWPGLASWKTGHAAGCPCRLCSELSVRNCSLKGLPLTFLWHTCRVSKDEPTPSPIELLCSILIFFETCKDERPHSSSPADSRHCPFCRGQRPQRGAHSSSLLLAGLGPHQGTGNTMFEENTIEKGLKVSLWTLEVWLGKPPHTHTHTYSSSRVWGSLEIADSKGTHSDSNCGA